MQDQGTILLFRPAANMACRCNAPLHAADPSDIVNGSLIPIKNGWQRYILWRRLGNAIDRFRQCRRRLHSLETRLLSLLGLLLGQYPLSLNSSQMRVIWTHPKAALKVTASLLQIVFRNGFLRHRRITIDNGIDALTCLRMTGIQRQYLTIVVKGVIVSGQSQTIIGHGVSGQQQSLFNRRSDDRRLLHCQPSAGRRYHRRL
jgi:hypothetical protein